jgi:hypothetical protein
MIYECIICGVRWSPFDNYNEEEISSGICIDCMRSRCKDRIRKEQKQYSGDICFLTGRDNCKEYSCSYRQWCQKDSYEEWKKTLLDG